MLEEIEFPTKEQMLKSGWIVSSNEVEEWEMFEQGVNEAINEHEYSKGNESELDIG
jgi:hypothetical protein